MELLEIADAIIYIAVAIIAAIVFARRGQLALLRQLLSCVSSDIDTQTLYEHFPKSTKLLISGKAVEKLCTPHEGSDVSKCE